MSLPRESLVLPVREGEKYLTRFELADILGVHPGTIVKWQRENGLPSVLFAPQTRRYLLSQVQEWAVERERRRQRDGSPLELVRGREGAMRA